MKKENIVDLVDKSVLNRMGLKLIIAGIIIAIISMTFVFDIKLPSLIFNLNFKKLVEVIISHTPFEMMLTTSLGILILHQIYILYKCTLWSNITVLKNKEKSTTEDIELAIKLLAKDIANSIQFDAKIKTLKYTLYVLLIVSSIITLLGKSILTSDTFVNLLSVNFTDNAGHLLWIAVAAILCIINELLECNKMFESKAVPKSYAFSYPENTLFDNTLKEYSSKGSWHICQNTTPNFYAAMILIWVVKYYHTDAISTINTSEPLVFKEDVALSTRETLQKTVESKVLTERINKDFGQVFNSLNITQLGCMDYFLDLNSKSELYLTKTDRDNSYLFAMRNNAIESIDNGCRTTEVPRITLRYKIYKKDNIFMVRIPIDFTKKYSVDDMYALMNENINAYLKIVENNNEVAKKAKQQAQKEIETARQY